jgi:hypothetical protein
MACGRCGADLGGKEGICAPCWAAARAARAAGQAGPGARAPDGPPLPTTLVRPPPLPAAPPPARRPRGYLARHLAGDLSLPVSSWLNGFAFAALARGAFAAAGAVDPTRHARLYGAGVVAAWAFFLAGQAGLLVGIWRAAGRHAARGGSFGGLARAAVVFGWAVLAAAAVTQAAPQVAEHARIAASPEGGFVVRALRGGAEAEIRGALDFGVSDAFEALLDRAPAVRVVHLNSGGGRLAEARRLAGLIEGRGLVTYVATECQSACVVAFAAGTERWLSPEAVIGLHRPTAPGVAAAAFSSATDEGARYLRSRGVAGWLVERGYRTPPEEMWTPTHEEVLRAGLATGHAPWGAVALSGIAPSDLGAVRRKLAQLPLYAELREHEPAVFAEVVAAFEAGWTEGRSLEEVRAITFPRISAVFEKSLPNASDLAERHFAELVVDQGRALQRVDAGACARALSGTADGATLARLPSAMRERELRVQAEVIRSARTQRREAPPLADVEGTLGQVVARLPPGVAADLALLDDPAAPGREPARYCEACIALYEAILARPDAEAGPLLRALVAAK